MKKFMKAIAFVTVMCMALSTVAFAAVEEGATAELTGEKVLDITVTGAAEDEQVALMVVASDATDLNSPLYIDQKAANASGEATFEAVLTNAEIDAVDIYVGFATYANANSSSWKIGNDVAITEPVSITVKKAGVMFTENKTAENGEIGAGVGATFTVEAPEGYEAVSMFWALEYMDGETKKFKYTDLQDITAYGFGTVIENKTAVTLGITFLNGDTDEDKDFDTYDFKDVDAIFVFKNVADPVVTDSDVLENRTAKNN